MRIFTSLFVAAAGRLWSERSVGSSELDRGTSSEELRHRGGESNPNPMLFPKDARPYGRSIDAVERAALELHLFDSPGPAIRSSRPPASTAGSTSDGPVWFLPAVPGSTLGTNISRSCTIPRGRAIMLQMSSALNDYPCPDPNFQPAPGQSLYDFLIDAIKPLFEGVTGFVVTLDGVNIQDPLSYRFYVGRRLRIRAGSRHGGVRLVHHPEAHDWG